MAEKPQTEGVIDTQTPTTPSIQAAHKQETTNNGINHGRESAVISTQPHLADFIQEENRVPQIVPEQDPPSVTPLGRLTGEPAWIDCPHCKRRAKTRISKEGTTMQTIATIPVDGPIQFAPVTVTVNNIGQPSA
ncbi:hypothetical protein M426DRAFT_26623 [Hypoxylon sp. CI-4A]|nr:hypothetical protein M426DRAFT_26623 [Hypoxylon sp. CI-4A]